jgi:uncharacterized OB-fold protein
MGLEGSSNEQSGFMSEAEVPYRVLPRLDALNEAFWQGGREGELRFHRCSACGLRLHPPVPICPECGTSGTAAEAVSGRATVVTFTTNHQNWMPGPDLPYVVAIVEIEEDPRIRLTTNIVSCEPAEVYIGMPVEVVFEYHAHEDGDIWLPLFRPLEEVA